MSKKSDRIERKAAATVKSRHKEPASGPKEVVAKPAKVVKPAVEGALPKLPKLPTSGSKARKPKPLADCACGCGTQTRSKWAPGHDARARGWAIRIEREILTMKDVPENERAGAKLMLAEREEARKNGGKPANLKLAKKKAKEAPAAEEPSGSVIPDADEAEEADEAVSE